MSAASRVVEAAGGRRRPRVVVDHLQRGADRPACLAIGGACAQASSLTTGRVLRLVVVLDRAADPRFADELDQAELVQRAHVVGDGAEGALEHLRELDRARLALHAGWRGCAPAAGGSWP